METEEAAPAGDDIFGGDAAAPAGDDIFGGAAMEPAGEDIFGGAAPVDEPATESGDAAPATLDEVINGEGAAPEADDIFGDGAAMEPAADDIFGGQEEAAEPIEDVFGAPPADEAPAEGDAIDNIFGVAPEADASEAADDIFAAPVNTEKPEAPAVDLEDIFSGSPEKLADQTPVKTVANPLAVTEARVWIDNTGGFSTTGRLIKIASDHVKLQKENGRTCTVPMRRLSPADAAYVQSIAGQLPAETVAMLINH